MRYKDSICKNCGKLNENIPFYDWELVKKTFWYCRYCGYKQIRLRRVKNV